MELQAWMKRERYTDIVFINDINMLLKEDGAKLLGFRAVKPWRDGLVVPRPQVMAAITRLTKGEVTYDDMYQKNLPHRRRNRPDAA